MNDAMVFSPGRWIISADEYYAVEAMSYSGAKKILQSPAHYKLAREVPSVATPQMMFGEAVHCGILEPKRFPHYVLAAPTIDKRTNVGKAMWAAFVEESAGKLVLSADDFVRACRCIDAANAHPTVRKLLDNATVEESFFWIDKQFDVPCKARLDARRDGLIIDLKTCADASPEGFARAAANYKYHLQGAMYFTAAEHVLDATPEAFILIALESAEPFATAFYEIESDAMVMGGHLRDQALERYAVARKTKTWEGYRPTIERLKLPKWALQYPDEY